MTVKAMTPLIDDVDHCPECGSTMTSRSKDGWITCRKCKSMWKDDTTLGLLLDDRY